MKSTWLILGFMLLKLAVVEAIAKDQSSYSSEWQSFKEKYGKQYLLEEDEWRFDLFLKDMAEIYRFNREESQDAGFILEVNMFSDLTPDEMEIYLGYKLDISSVAQRSLSDEAEQFLAELLRDDDDLPESLDWRQKEGRVSSVKHQGVCGSCWAMALAGLLEGQELNVTNRMTLVDLSVQNIMDCIDPPTKPPCNGRFPGEGIEVLARIGGIMSEEDYPYKAADGQECEFDISKSIVSPREAILLPRGDELAIKKVVARYGPVLVIFEVDEYKFSRAGTGEIYKGGQKCGSKYDHALLVIGYGTDPVQGDYWLIKNSWGAQWGDGGYFKMAMGYNNCGVLDWPMIAMF